MLLICAGGFVFSSGLIDSIKYELSIREKADTAHKQQARLLIHLSFYSDTFKDKEHYLYKAINISQKYGYKDYEAIAFAYRAADHGNIGNMQKSIEYGIKSAQLYRELGLYDQEAHALNTIASTLNRAGDFENALNYFKQSLLLFTQRKDSIYSSFTLLNIGENFRSQQIPDSAMHYFELAKRSLESIHNIPSNMKSHFDVNYATIYGNIGMVFFSKGNFKQAKYYLNIAIDYFTTNFDAYRKSVYQFELGKIHITEGNVELGEQLIKHSFDLAKTENLKEQIMDFSRELSLFYEDQKKHEKALRYHKIYKTYFDSIQNISNVRKIDQIESDFQISKKEEEINSLNRINLLQKRFNYALLLGVFVIISFLFYLFKSNRKIKTTNILLQEQKQLVEQRENEKALLLKELNHRVKNNLQMVASLLNLHSRQLKGHPAADALKAGVYRVEALTLIHQKLYRDDVDTKINIKDYVEELSRNLILNFSQNFDLKLELDDVHMKIDKAIPLGLLLNELLTNSLKYGKQDNKAPLLIIKITKVNDLVSVIINDNGPGLPPNFSLTKAKSFGLKLVHSLTKQLGGTINWNSENGTTWTLSLSYSKLH